MGHALPTHFLASDLCPPPLPRRCRNKLFGGGGGGERGMSPKLMSVGILTILFRETL